MQPKQQGEPESSNMGIDSCQSLVCSQGGDNKKIGKNSQDYDLFNKLSSLLMTSGFETTLIQMLLKEMYCRDKKAIPKYENIRRTAAIKAKKEFGDIQAGKNLDLQETIRALSNELERLSNQNEVLIQEKIKLQQKIKSLQEEANTADNETSLGIEGILAYIKLTTWYETMLVEVKKIKDENSGWIRVQSWENAMAWYINEYPKPKVGTYIVKDVWGKWVMEQKK